MNLQQSINFLSQSAETVNAARTRLDKAVRELAGFISDKGLTGEGVTVNGVRYEITETKSNIQTYKYLAVEIGDFYYKSLEDFTDYSLHGDFNARVIASSRAQRLEFAMNCNEIVKAFCELWQHKAARFNAGAIIAEKIKTNN